ncbi:hypothetical protein LXA43DRAFT_706421 [Ganoderma leucocontextum]|nr:hypothetical protein LXA43DRAFT_706421 [Ganoderma leucocontextum]
MTPPPHTSPQLPVPPIPLTGESITPLPKPHIVFGDKVTDEQLVQCAALFSENYGIWGSSAPKPLKPGTRVKMQPKKLRAECLSDDPGSSVISMMYMDGRLVGQAFATKWSSPSSGTEKIGWITQLVVDANERRKHIATTLLRELTTCSWFAGVTVMGIASTHPAACHTLCNMLDQDISSISLSYIQENAPKALQSSTVKYLRQAQLKGSLFETVDDGAISLVDTTFYVDHGEPEEVLSSYVAENKWLVGILREGHEFLLVLPTASSRST